MISGSVNFLNLVSASGSITIAILSDRFTIEFDVMLTIGPIALSAYGFAGVYADSNPGLVLRLGVSIDVNIFDVFKIDADGELQLNTTGIEREGIGANSFRLALLK